MAKGLPGVRGKSQKKAVQISSGEDVESSGKRPASRSRLWWPWLRRGITALFFIAVATLLVSQARMIEWGEVLVSLQRYPLGILAGALALAVLSFLLYSCFDLLGRRYTGHTLGTGTVMLVTFISYAFNLNLGSLVGGVAFRFRLYSKLGLRTGLITRVLAFSMLTNWTGYLLLGGLVFSLMPPAGLPPNWTIDSAQLRFVGLVLVALAGGYVALCAFSRQRTLRLRGHAIDLPSARMAFLQLLMGAGNWLVMSAIVFVLLQQRIEFSAVVGVLLLAAIAGVITHIPAGLGVLEAVFVALLSHQVPRHELLAALVAYRVIYYVMPLVLASALYFMLEAKAKKSQRSD
jgi:glycosyltransferase 2 family protein